MSSPDVETNNQQILNDIQSLQSIESNLFNKLEANPNISLQDRSDLMQKINEISEMRINLYKTLGDMSVFFQASLENSQGTLSNQTQTIGIVEEELKKARMNLKVLEEEKNNKIRLIEINQYYGDKYIEHGQLMRILIIMLVPLLILALLYQKGVLPKNVYYILVSLVAFIGAFFFINRWLSIMYRDNMNYQEYDWNFDPDGAPTASNTNTVDPWVAKNVSNGTCIGDACCTSGMSWDASLNQCSITSGANNNNSSTTETFINNALTKPAYKYKKPDVTLGGDNISPSFASGFTNYSSF